MTKNTETQRRCVLMGRASPRMHVRLLKKINEHQFVGQVLSSNAIVRFQTEAPLIATEGTLCHVTNCRFDCGTKLVKCQAIKHADAGADRLSWPDIVSCTIAPHTTGARTAGGTRPDDPGPPHASKRKRVTFSDDEAACSASC